jgi:predicted RecA/RadA family phage recombinase
MARNYIQPGEVIDFTPAADVASGEPVAIGSRVGVAHTDVAAGETGTFAVLGVYSLPKTNSALAQGVAVFLTPAGQISGTATGNTPAGYAWDAVDAAATMVSVKLLG